jgi:Protease inhibitor Inh
MTLRHDDAPGRLRYAAHNQWSPMVRRLMPIRLARLSLLLLPLVLAGCATDMRSSQPAQPQGIDMNGRWMLSNGAQSCGVTFANADAASGTVRPEGGCPGDLFKSRQWTFENGRVIVRDHQSQPLATFASGGAGLQGQGNDGQPLTLTRG